MKKTNNSAHVPELQVVVADQEVPATGCARFFLFCEQVPQETVTVGLRKLLGSRAFQRQQ